MSPTVTTLLAGVVFGLALAAPPGPMNAIIAEESVVRGWNAGFRAGLGAATADAVFLILAAVGVVAVVAEVVLLRAAMVFVGGLLMLYFAYGAATSARTTFVAEDGGDRIERAGADDDRPGRTSADVGGGERTGGPRPSSDEYGESDGARPGRTSTDVDAAGKGFRKAFVLALTNPYQILFWLTVGVGLLEPGTVDVLASASDALAGLVVVRTGSPALVVGLFGGIGVWITGFPAALAAARERVDALAPLVAGGSATVLAAFGVYFLADAVRTVA